jgi:hypothetical protein
MQTDPLTPKSGEGERATTLAVAIEPEMWRDCSKRSFLRDLGRAWHNAGYLVIFVFNTV